MHLLQINRVDSERQGGLDTVTSSYDGSENPALISSASLLGDANTTILFSALISARMPNRPNECAELLLALREDSSHCFPEVTESARIGLDRIGTAGPKSDEEAREPKERCRPLVPLFLVNLFQALRRFKGKTFCDSAAEKIAARPETFSPVTIVVPALRPLSLTRTEIKVIDPNKLEVIDSVGCRVREVCV